jgi:hypothetical protein
MGDYIPQNIECKEDTKYHPQCTSVSELDILQDIPLYHCTNVRDPRYAGILANGVPMVRLAMLPYSCSKSS